MEYVVVDKEKLESDLTIVADAIREKGGTTEKLEFPLGMKRAVESIPSGGSGGLEDFEKIVEINITEEITKLVINQDSNGQPFELKKALLLYKLPIYTGESTIPTYFFSLINNQTIGQNAPLFYTSVFAIPSKTAKRDGWWLAEYINGLRHEKVLKNNNANSSNNIYGALPSQAGLYGEMFGDDVNITKITSIGFTGGLAYEGCKFVLFGVRA